MSKKAIVKELNTELAMRKKVWAQNGGAFVKLEHQKRYDTLALVFLPRLGNFQSFLNVLQRTVTLTNTHPCWEV